MECLKFMSNGYGGLRYCHLLYHFEVISQLNDDCCEIEQLHFYMNSCWCCMEKIFMEITENRCSSVITLS